MARRLTLKQKTFVKEYLANGGNGTQAAMMAYNAKDSGSAGEIASQNLKKVEIQKALNGQLEKKGLTLKQITGNIARMAVHEIENPSAKVVLNANITLLKLLGGFPDDKQRGSTTNVQINVENLDYKVIKEQLGTIDASIEHIMGTKEAHSVVKE